MKHQEKTIALSNFHCTSTSSPKMNVVQGIVISCIVSLTGGDCVYVYNSTYCTVTIIVECLTLKFIVWCRVLEFIFLCDWPVCKKFVYHLVGNFHMMQNFVWVFCRTKIKTTKIWMIRNWTWTLTLQHVVNTARLMLSLLNLWAAYPEIYQYISPLITTEAIMAHKPADSYNIE